MIGVSATAFFKSWVALGGTLHVLHATFHVCLQNLPCNMLHVSQSRAKVSHCTRWRCPHQTHALIPTLCTKAATLRGTTSVCDLHAANAAASPFSCDGALASSHASHAEGQSSPTYFPKPESFYSSPTAQTATGRSCSCSFPTTKPSSRMVVKEVARSSLARSKAGLCL